MKGVFVHSYLNELNDDKLSNNEVKHHGLKQNENILGRTCDHSIIRLA
jgi:tRNA(Met) C34 N-acetyltransferase TmcA